MIIFSRFTKKHAAALVLGSAAIAATVFAVQNKNGAFTHSLAPIGEPVAVTLEAYRSQVPAAVSGFAASKEAISGIVERLSALKVPAEGVDAHFALVSDLVVYGRALSSGDKAGSDRALGRLKTLARQNDWMGLSIND